MFYYILLTYSLIDYCISSSSHISVYLSFLIYKSEACDNCVHILLDDLDFLQRNMTGVGGNLESVSAGVTALRRLEDINSTVVEYKVSSKKCEIKRILYTVFSLAIKKRCGFKHSNFI